MLNFLNEFSIASNVVLNILKTLPYTLKKKSRKFWHEFCRTHRSRILVECWPLWVDSVTRMAVAFFLVSMKFLF